MPMRCPVTSGVTTLCTRVSVRGRRGRRGSAIAPVRDACSVDQPLPLLVVIAGNAVGAGEDLLHRRVEPAIDGGEHDAAADDQHQHRGNHGHAEHREHQLGAEAAERQAAPPSIIDLMTLRASTNTSASSIVMLVAESAISTTSVRKSGDSVDGAIGEPDDAAERGEQDDDAGEDQRRVVAERPAARRDRGRTA